MVHKLTQFQTKSSQSPQKANTEKDKKYAYFAKQEHGTAGQAEQLSKCGKKFLATTYKPSQYVFSLKIVMLRIVSEPCLGIITARNLFFLSLVLAFPSAKSPLSSSDTSGGDALFCCNKQDGKDIA